MVKLTKEDENKLGQILKELNEMKDVLKGGEGSGQKGHKTPKKESEETYDQRRERLSWAPNMKRTKEERTRGERGYN